MSSNSQKTPQARSLNEFARRKVLDQIQKTGRALPCTAVSATGAIIKVKFEILSGFTIRQVTVPLFGPEYIRYPVQPGDGGIVISVDAQIGAICGLGTGTADLAQPANLGALVFLPIGNKAWSSVDPQSVTIYGPNGVVLYDTGKNSSITLTPDGIACVGKSNFSATVGDASVTLSDSQIVAEFDDATVTLDDTQVEVAFGPNTILVNAAGVVITSDGEEIMSSNGSQMQITWGTNSVSVSPSGVAITGVLLINGAPYLAHRHSGVTTGTGDSAGVV